MQILMTVMISNIHFDEFGILRIFFQ